MCTPSDSCIPQSVASRSMSSSTVPNSSYSIISCPFSLASSSLAASTARLVRRMICRSNSTAYSDIHPPMAISSELKVMTETIKDGDVMPQSLVCTGTWLLEFRWIGGWGCRIYARKTPGEDGSKEQRPPLRVAVFTLYYSTVCNACLHLHRIVLLRGDCNSSNDRASIIGGALE